VISDGSRVPLVSSSVRRQSGLAPEDVLRMFGESQSLWVAVRSKGPGDSWLFGGLPATATGYSFSVTTSLLLVTLFSPLSHPIDLDGLCQ
jgi:hypothetical protein